MPLRWNRSRAVIAESIPRRENEKDEAYDRRIRSRYVDVCRFILPAASLANVGMTANGRVIENSIRKWLSSPLAEVREIGETVKAVAQGELPTLVKYAEAVEYLVETPLILSPHFHRKWGRDGGGRMVFSRRLRSRTARTKFWLLRCIVLGICLLHEAMEEGP